MATIQAISEKDSYLADFEALRRDLAAREPERIRRLRADAADRFATLGFPTTRMEEWRWTDVAPIARIPFRLAPAPNGVAPTEVSRLAYPGCALAVFVDGHFVPALSDLAGLPAGVTVTGLARALAETPELVDPHLGRYSSFAEHAFVALNTAFLRDGAFLHAADGVVAEKPIHLLFVTTAREEPSACYPRNLLIAGEGSQVRVVESYATLGSGARFTCPVTEIAAGPGSVIDHYKVEQESDEAFHVATFQLHQERSSAFSSQSLSWGGALVRNDVNAVLDGEGADAILNGLYLAEGTQLVDFHMRVEHAKPHCTSHELFKGILEGRSRAVFNGRIYVHPGAQKTDAKQTNRNLLLSRQALCNSNPQLEIFADDVKCTHGSTVGQLDAEAVFYLRSRGIGEEAARSLLIYAFASDIVQRVKVEPVRQHLEEFLFRRLPKGEVVRQAV